MTLCAFSEYSSLNQADLRNVNIEELDTQFVPPDITPDMYDWVDENTDEYAAFLKDTFFRPILDTPEPNIGEMNQLLGGKKDSKKRTISRLHHNDKHHRRKMTKLLDNEHVHVRSPTKV